MFTVHPASHNLVTDISKCSAKTGILCAHRAYSSSWRSYVLLLCVEVTRRPSGSFVLIGFKVNLSSSIDASNSKKLLVAPLSNIVHYLISSKSKLIIFSNEFAACNKVLVLM